MLGIELDNVFDENKGIKNGEFDPKSMPKIMKPFTESLQKEKVKDHANKAIVDGI